MGQQVQRGYMFVSLLYIIEGEKGEGDSWFLFCPFFCLYAQTQTWALVLQYGRRLGCLIPGKGKDEIGVGEAGFEDGYTQQTEARRREKNKT